MNLSHAIIALAGASATETICYQANQAKTGQSGLQPESEDRRPSDLRSDCDVIRSAKVA